MIDTPRPNRWWAAVAAGALLCACSSSGGTDESSRPPSSSASRSAAPADVAKGVSHAYVTFFDSRSSTAQSEAALQHGASFATTLADESSSGYADKSTAKVTKVTLVSPKVADVVFTVYSGDTALLPDSSGKAVLEGTTWKVAARTFCGLVKLEGKSPAACADPKITALPD